MKIGNIELKGKVVLAPMAGISNPAYIKILEEMGISYAVTELISAEGIVRNNKKTLDMLNGINDIKIPVAIQIFGSSPETMAQASKVLVDLYKVKIIDINMGCPVPKVAIHSKAGSALLKNIPLIKEIVKSVKEAVPIPVTVKIRSGWDHNSINAVEVAKACEESGASAITVHPRTRSQLYTGVSDIEIIKQVKENVSIPVIGNGDITDIESAIKMLNYTKCDAIMIGRGLLGNPWLAKEINTYLEEKKVIEKPTNKEKIAMCLHHLDYLLQYKDEKVAILEMRSHIAWYIKGMPYHKEVQAKCFKAKTKEEIKEILDNYLKKLYN